MISQRKKEVLWVLFIINLITYYNISKNKYALDSEFYLDKLIPFFSFVIIALYHTFLTLEKCDKSDDERNDNEIILWILLGILGIISITLFGTIYDLSRYTNRGSDRMFLTICLIGYVVQFCGVIYLLS